MDNIKFIKGFGKITVSEACRKCNINRSTLINGWAGKEKEKEVADSIQEDLDRLYKECEKDEDREI